MTTITKLHLNWSDYDIGAENVKVFELSSTSDLVNAQAAYDWYANWWFPIISRGGLYYRVSQQSSSVLTFSAVRAYGTSSWTWAWLYDNWLEMAISSDTVTGVTSYSSLFQLRTSAPITWDNKTITLVI